MSNQRTTTTHSTFVIERKYPTTCERVFAAFSDPAKKVRWHGQGEHHDVEEFKMEFRVGGFEMTFSRFKANSMFPGVTLTNEGIYQDIVPNERIIMATSMALGGRRMSVSLTTFEFLEADGGTDLILTVQGIFFEGSDGPKLREQGWRKVLERLATELAA